MQVTPWRDPGRRATWSLVTGFLLILVGLPSWGDTSCMQAKSGEGRCAVSLAHSGPEAVEKTVFVKTETFLSGWVEYNTGTCTLVSSGSWAITTPPTQGTTTTRIVNAQLSNGACPGVTFPFNVLYYTWTGTKQNVQTDSLAATWTSPDFTQPDTFTITQARVDITAVDLNAGTAAINIVGPVGATGTLSLTFTGTATTALPETTTSYVSGTYSIPIDRPALRPGLYKQVTAKWNAHTPPVTGKYKPTAAWDVLGIIRYSQYNTPLESECGGGQVSVWIVDSVNTCNFSKGKLKSSFITQTNINGTGNSVKYGLVKPGPTTLLKKGACEDDYPPGADINNSYVQVPTVTGTCNSPIVAGTSVATFQRMCNASELLVEKPANTNFANKAVDDTCPSCDGDFRGADGHIDNYIASQSCKAHDALDLGNYWTLQTK